MWESLFFVGAVILASAIAYGIFQSQTKSKANRRVTEAATKALYQDPDRYESEIKPKLERDGQPER